ncbi:FkbM family methyltransferase [Telmatospirillum sp.]|uniref:FkbM family methyltransferase n=1 Tax=Telmatospirillum sp. TaxID=2079197 RepID=UPI002844418D|nr:FkbM family methyltransferase [Telmatospirillum sp.]MDR3438632.1 FkbM family methyltransferase [Telmatospirillum sp.]
MNSAKLFLRGVFRNLFLCIPQVRRLCDSRDTLSERLAICEAQKTSRSPFFHYNASFDPQEIIRKFEVTDRQGKKGYYTNFMGVRTAVKYFPSFLTQMDGLVEAIPIPANWHADIAEWGAALRAVELARGKFTIIELGCGWGCWMNNTGVAARMVGLDVHLIGVEGDEAHIESAREACAVNGFRPDQVTLNRGIAASTAGIALFPRVENGADQWGLEPVFGASEEQRREATRSGHFDELPMITLDEIAAPHDRIDLLHVDIQGGEVDLIGGCLPLINEKVAYLLVGTHSRQIDGRLMDMMLNAGWKLEIERPTIFTIDAGGIPCVTVDGVQGWRNPKIINGMSN